MRSLLVLMAVALGVVILGISIIQVRGVVPGEEQLTLDLADPNSELSLYMANPGYLATVMQQRAKAFFSFDPVKKTEYMIFLANERFELSGQLLSNHQTSLGLWLWRKALIYQNRALVLLSQLDEPLRLRFSEILVTQISEFGEQINIQHRILRDADLVELNLLTTMLKDNTQVLQSLMPQK